jgi:hypothetical protein
MFVGSSISIPLSNEGEQGWPACDVETFRADGAAALAIL